MDLPKNIGNPATNALANIGITKLEQLKKLTEKELLNLHGVGPKAVGILKQELKKRNLSFRAITQDNSSIVEMKLEKLHHPLIHEIGEVRNIIKSVNKNITEEWKWNAPSYSYGEYLVTFNLRPTDKIHLVFHNPNIVKIKSKLLEGDYTDRRMIYFHSMKKIVKNRKELKHIIQTLIHLKNVQISSISDI